MMINVCVHGSLRRKCDICDLLDEIDELKNEIKRLRALVDPIYEEPRAAIDGDYPGCKDT